MAILAPAVLTQLPTERDTQSHELRRALFAALDVHRRGYALSRTLKTLDAGDVSQRRGQLGAVAGALSAEAKLYVKGEHCTRWEQLKYYAPPCLNRSIRMSRIIVNINDENRVYVLRVKYMDGVCDQKSLYGSGSARDSGSGLQRVSYR